MSERETMAVGRKLVELCNAGKGMEAIDTLYDDDIVSVEAAAHPSFDQTMSGVPAVRGKSEWWYANHEVHRGETDGPYPNGDRFITFMKFDLTPKVGPMAGNRFTMQEMGLYTVKGSKIVKEEFFYHMG